MTATLWIHRCSGSDLLVRLPTAHDAYNLGARFLFAYQSPVEEENFVDSWNESRYTEDEMFHVGDTPSLQLSVHPGKFHPEDDKFRGKSDWATETFIVTPEEVMALGEDGVPECAGGDADEEKTDFEAHYNRLDRQYAEAVEEAKAHRLATSAFGYDERLDAPIDWSRWVKPARKNSADDL